MTASTPPAPASPPSGKPPTSTTEAGEFSVSREIERRTTWFIKLRWLAAAGVIGMAALLRLLSLSNLAVGPILAFASALIFYNAVLSVIAGRLRNRPVKQIRGGADSFVRLLAPRALVGLGHEAAVARTATFASAQITLDFLFLAVLLHFCGGVESPFSVFFVFHVVLTSILLSRRATYFETTVGFLLFAAVVLGEYFGVIGHHPLDWFWPADAYRSWKVIATTLGVLGTTLYLVSYLCTTIATDLHEGIRDNVLLARQLAGDRRKLEIAYQTLRESERTKSQYMRKVAHELRGPLGTIETALKVVLQGMAGEVGESSRELIGRAQRRAGELSAVTHDLLLLARAREAGRDEQPAPIAVAGLLADVIGDFSESAAAKGVTLSLDTDAEGVVYGDPVAIRQIVANLVENAIRYTQPGGSVTVASRSQSRNLVLEVVDTGIGIGAEDLPRVFDEFYRGAHAREYAAGGTGLGLAIVKAIAKHGGGDVAVESKLGQGTRFTVTLPGRA